MAIGTPPLRLSIRNSPRKNTQESVESSGSDVGIATPSRIGTITSARKALTPIAEIVSNPLTSDVPVCEAIAPSRKRNVTTPQKQTVENKSFSDAENATDCKEGSAVGTLGNLAGITPGRSKNILAGLSKKSPVVARSVQELCYSETQADGARTPKRRLAYNPEVVQIQTSTKSSTKIPFEHLTPKVFRSAGRKVANEAEVGTSSRCGPAQLITPSSARSTRPLKHGGAGGILSSGLGIRASVSSSLNRQLVMPQTSPHFIEQPFDLEQDPNFWDDHNVQVLIRSRPINNAEMASQGYTRCLKQENAHCITWLGQPESRFTFDHVAGDSVTQDKLFRVVGLPMVENCMSGYNSCMFAYGQTGSGKTHTMLGDLERLDRSPSDNRGITPRVFEYLFERIRQEEESRKHEKLMFMCRCSFLEIYNEQITDLLEPTSTNLHMREDTRTGVYVENLSEVEVQNVQDVIDLLIQGASNRRVAATNMNRESSRSHSVFTCIVESKWECDSLTNIRFGRLNLVDLAGSERQKSSGAEGDRLKEAASINKSLSTLGLVIMTLVDIANGKQRHVPYRDSKLTFLLQDSLGGNSKTIIIATVSPASCNAVETLSTLKFAQRAKLIRNTAVVNEDATGDVKALKLQLQLMKEELERIRRQSISSIPSALLPVDRSWDATRALGSPTGTNKQLKAMESIVAGALRREKAAEDVTERLASEIEQLNRLVRERQQESQNAKLILRFREDKIRRLEALSQGMLELDSYLAQDKRMLCEEIKLLKAQLECNPEITRFAMEKNQLLDQIKSLKDFQDGKQEVMAQEISNLRDKVLEMLEGKIANEHVRSSLSASQGHIATSEIIAKDREIELLRTEANAYRSDLEHCRNNLNSVLESHSATSRQVVDLQALVEQLRGSGGEENCLNRESNYELLEKLQTEQLQHTMELKSQLEQMELKAEIEGRKSHLLESQLQESLQEAHNLHNQLQKLTPNTQEVESCIRMETEEAGDEQKRKLIDYDAMAVMWNHKESDLRAQLEKVQSAMDTILEKQGREHEEVLVYQEEIRRLRQELISLEASRNEEQALREHFEKKNKELAAELNRQLEEASSKLAQEKAIIDALENQHLLAMNEIDTLQESHKKLVLRLKRREEKGRMLKRRIDRLGWELTKEHELRDVEREMEDREKLNEEELMALELKLENARKELETARALNEKIQEEQHLQTMRQQDLDYSRSEVETETAFAITSMQDELMAMEDEWLEKETAAQEQVARVREELADTLRMLNEIRHENVNLRKEHDAMMKEKDAEISTLRRSWEAASGKIIDYLAEGDQALFDAVQEMEYLVELSIPSGRVQQTNKNKAYEFLCEQLKLAQDVARETERKVRALCRAASEASPEADSNKLSLSDRESVCGLLRGSQKFENATNEIIARKGCSDRRVVECETMLTSIQADLAHAELKLRQAEDRNLELAKAQEALIVTSQQWDLEKTTLISTLRAVEQQYAVAQQALSDLQVGTMFSEAPEGVTEEVEELRLAKEKWDMQKKELENELVELRAALTQRDAEFIKQRMSDAKEAVVSRDKSRLTESKVAGYFVEDENCINQNLEVERHDAGEAAVRLVNLIKKKEIVLKDTNDALAQLKLELEKALEAHDSHQQHSVECVAEREELLFKCESLEKCLNIATSNTFHAEERLDTLQLLIEEFSQAEGKWKLKISNLTSQVEVMRSLLADKEAEWKTLKNENEQLHIALLSAQKEGISVACELTALKQKLRRSDSHGRDQLDHVEQTIEINHIDHGQRNPVLDRRRETEMYEDEITKLIMLVAQSEERLVKLELDWRREKERLLAERDIARMDAKQKGSEAAALARNFERNRATLWEAEMMVDALVQAKDSARSDGEAWKLENDRLRLAHEVALKNVYEETLEVLAIIKEEVDKTKNHCEKEIATMTEDIYVLIDGLHISIGALQHDFKKAQMSISLLAEELGFAEEIQHNYSAGLLEEELAALNTASANDEEEYLIMKDQIAKLRTLAIELDAELQVKVCAVKGLEQELLHAEKLRDSLLQEAESNIKEVESQRDSLQVDLSALKKELGFAQHTDKDVDLQALTTRIPTLMLLSGGQATEYHCKLNDLSSMVEQFKVEDRRLSSARSPFSRIDKGILQTQTADLDAEFHAQERRIQELEVLAVDRQQEISVLNSRLAEAESQTYDVVQELLGVKLDISNYTETQHLMQRLAVDVRRQSITPNGPGRNLVQGAEIQKLRDQLDELVGERESWLEDLNKRHAEIVALQISAEKMRHRDLFISAENEKLKLDNAGYIERITELEKDIKKLSGQQNLQQRIQHHAKIKEENTALRHKIEDLSAKLRRTEVLLARVTDELAKYRTAEGKTPLLNIDEEQCLRIKLQEAEDAKIQMAQKLLKIYSSIVKVADCNLDAREVDHELAMLALEKLQGRIRSTEQELAETKFKSKIDGEKRRLSDLRAALTPSKSINISGDQNLFCQVQYFS
ncbi:kinesin-like protein KIN-12C isoform X3 [Physcomitrium patens]|uniref:kinesin-like protein KIN-12C isoform X3 n=1 Tax=Physcomitrium patens TaxID=3218 RepID=UPI00024AD001|nr:kinesin-like protein KIN-12E isoform X1 [Physcomitrium patens]XP_024384208.1 kinesin-like protein KIN-12E isoform X1 [Physcomitrium patens]|eukprot:XP_024384201.1 kinesin-like protein KIN-12E isoform X1 [Physcomitrella patens]